MQEQLAHANSWKKIRPACRFSTTTFDALVKLQFWSVSPTGTGPPRATTMQPDPLRRLALLLLPLGLLLLPVRAAMWIHEAGLNSGIVRVSHLLHWCDGSGRSI